MKGLYHTLAIIFGIIGSVLAVLAVAVFEGFLPASLVDNLTATELGTLSALSVVVAVAAYAADGRRRD